MTQTFYRDRFTWLVYLLLAFYAYFLNVLGPITPFLKEELRLSYTVSSLHFTAFAVGILAVGFGGHLLIRRLGRWRSLWLGSAGLSLGALLLVSGASPLITISAAFVMGLVGSLILAIVPAALSDQHGPLRPVALAEANVLSSLVATAAPLLVGGFAHFSGDWRPALAVVALTPLFLFLGLGRGSAAVVSASERPTPSGRPLPLLFWLYWLALVLSISVEFCLIYWSADYLEQVLRMAKADAAQAVSLFLAGMILGRFTGSRTVQRWSTSTVVTGSILIASLGFLLFWQTNTVIVGLTGLFITGLGVANLYPLILSLAMSTVSHNTVQASARATLASGTAILSLPLILGRLADAVGIGLAFGVVVVLLATVFLISQLAGRVALNPAWSQR